MNLPPTVGELVAALRHMREAMALCETATLVGLPLIVALGHFDGMYLDGLLERIDAPVDENQPRDVSQRKGFA